MDLKTVSTRDRDRVLQQLGQTVTALEQMLLNGLTTAGPATLKTLSVTFQEASRLRLLRLGGTLRNACEEITRFTQDDEQFSARRLVFFLNRCWILCKGIQTALAHNDQVLLEKLLWTPATGEPEDLQVVCLGVAKKISPGVFCAFEFRLYDLDNQRPLVWSTVFPLKPGVDIPAEGYLHLPQKQKFKASVFLDGKVVRITQARLTTAGGSAARIQLSDQSTVVAGDRFSDWSALNPWDIDSALQRIAAHAVTPLDVDVELQEEATWHDYQLGKPEVEDGRRSYTLRILDTHWTICLSTGVENDATIAKLDAIAQQDTPLSPLFGLIHYARGAIEFQPLTAFGRSGPDYLTISEQHIDRAALLRALDFTS